MIFYRLDRMFSFIGPFILFIGLLLCRGVKPPNEFSGYDTKQSNGEVPVMLELWGMRSTPSLPSLAGRLWLGVVAPERVLSMGQIKLNCVLMQN